MSSIPVPRDVTPLLLLRNCASVLTKTYVRSKRWIHARSLSTHFLYGLGQRFLASRELSSQWYREYHQMTGAGENLYSFKVV
jgi:hypothetical protein